MAFKHGNALQFLIRTLCTYTRLLLRYLLKNSLILILARGKSQKFALFPYHWTLLPLSYAVGNVTFSLHSKVHEPSVKAPCAPAHK